jgi:antitoxin component YwqK of YwqJK toxin-antitoxin module
MLLELVSNFRAIQRKTSIFIFIFSSYYGLCQDTIKEYWENKSIKSLKISNPDSLNSIYFYYNTGKLRFKGQEVNNKKEGKWLYFRDNGTILKTDFYKKGLLDSLSIHWGANNKIEEIRSYKNDTLNGFSFSFYNTGQLMILNYNLSGESVYSETYYEKLNKINGLKNQLPKQANIVKNYYPEGSIKRIVFQLNGSFIVLHFDKKGILVKEPEIW